VDRSPSRLPVSPWCAGTQPPAVCPAPAPTMVRICPCQKSPSVVTEAATHPVLARTIDRDTALRPCNSTLVRHRGPPLQSPWKTQCAQSIHSRPDACPWNVKATTGCGEWSCAGLGAHTGESGAVQLVVVSGGLGSRAAASSAVIERRRWDHSRCKILQRQR